MVSDPVDSDSPFVVDRVTMSIRTLPSTIDGVSDPVDSDSLFVADRVTLSIRSLPSITDQVALSIVIHRVLLARSLSLWTEWLY